MKRHEFFSYCLREVLNNKPRWKFLRLLKIRFFGAPNRQAVVLLRWSQLLKIINCHRLAKKNFQRLVRIYGVYVGSETKIGPGLRLPHPTAIVIGQHILIGENARIFQNVTIGGLPKGRSKPLARLGDNVTVFPGAIFVGEACVGDNVVVGANAVVSKAFGSDVIIGGVPAKVIRYLERGETSDDF
ncbi:MAG TPA: hypothetical protein VLO13_08980 [Halomonas sp.]|nr:hypothetical protein [Halomonas sp.]